MEHRRSGTDELIWDIIDMEWEMFVAVNPREESVCRNRPETFRRMRWMSHCVLPFSVLQSYRRDLKQARAAGRNLMTEKYARMEGLILPLKTNPLIIKIVDIEDQWMQELISRYPHTFARARESFRRYARCELETYSDGTLQRYWEFVKNAVEKHSNLVETRYERLFEQMGFGTLDEVERGQRAKR